MLKIFILDWLRIFILNPYNLKDWMMRGDGLFLSELNCHFFICPRVVVFTLINLYLKMTTVQASTPSTISAVLFRNLHPILFVFSTIRIPFQVISILLVLSFSQKTRSPQKTQLNLAVFLSPWITNPFLIALEHPNFHLFHRYLLYEFYDLTMIGTLWD